MLSALEWHVKHHRMKDGSLSQLRSCRRCVLAKARCAGKEDYRCRAEADKRALQVNIERHWWPGSCQKAYRCRYCKVWHLTTATRDEDIVRVEKMRKKWMRRTHQKDNDEGYERDFDGGLWGLPETG